MTITLTREEAQQVLDALIWTTGSEDFSETGKARVGAIKVLFPAIETLRARLAQPEPEPVAWMFVNKFDGGEYLRKHSGEGLSNKDEFDIKPLYTAPPQRKEWQGLTDEEIGMLTVFDGLHHIEVPLLAKFVRAIEQTLREKNT